MADYDLAIIGGGLNGVSVARDAAGRGLRVILLEQGDLGAGASSASPRLIHGDPALLERRAFLRVRAALAERDIWLRIAPHLVRPMRFAIPAHADERQPWVLRAWLLLYDRIGARRHLPASATVDVTHHPVGDALKRPVVIDRGHRKIATARALVNATGAWTASVADTVLRVPAPPLGTVQINQIVVRRLFDGDNVYVFQNHDRRLIFASPYERDFTLIGTVGHPFKGDPAIVAMAASDVAYLCDAANRYFRERLETSDVVRTVSGVNSVMGANGRGALRDGSMTFDTRRGKAPLVTIFGGDITTARLRAERAVTGLTPFYPMSPPWTAKAPLPGGDFDWAKFEEEVDSARDQWRFLGEHAARRMVAAYGSRLVSILGDAREKSDLGPAFGPELTGAEVRYLMTKEWARFPDDILWRRSKLGLTMPAADREALAAFMAAMG